MADEYVPTIVLVKNNNRIQIVNIFPVKKFGDFHFYAMNTESIPLQMKAKVMMFTYLVLMEVKTLTGSLFSSPDKIVHPPLFTGK